MKQNIHELINNDSVKKIYNLALFSTGNPTIAEQATVDAFVSAFSKNSVYEMERFMERCTRIIYTYGKRATSKTNKYYLSRCLANNTYKPVSQNRWRLYEILGVFNYNDRFLILLFCFIRFTINQIAYVLRMPKFLVRKRIIICLNKVAMIENS